MLASSHWKTQMPIWIGLRRIFIINSKVESEREETFAFHSVIAWRLFIHKIIQKTHDCGHCTNFLPKKNLSLSNFPLGVHCPYFFVYIVYLHQAHYSVKTICQLFVHPKLFGFFSSFSYTLSKRTQKHHIDFTELPKALAKTNTILHNSICFDSVESKGSSERNHSLADIQSALIKIPL